MADSIESSHSVEESKVESTVSSPSFLTDQEVVEERNRISRLPTWKDVPDPATYRSLSWISSGELNSQSTSRSSVISNPFSRHPSWFSSESSATLYSQSLHYRNSIPNTASKLKSRSKSPEWKPFDHVLAPIASHSLLLDADPNLNTLNIAPSKAKDRQNLRVALDNKDLDRIGSLLGGLANDFETIDYQWIHELFELNFSTEEIIELLLQNHDANPLLSFERDWYCTGKLNLHYHRMSCVHKRGFQTSLEPAVITSPTDPSELFSHIKSDLSEQSDVRRLIAERCGIAGVVSAGRVENRSGQVLFQGHEDCIATISFKPDTAIDQPADAALTVSAVMDDIYSICAWMQEENLCCQSFTVLVMKKAYRCVEMRRIQFSLLSRLRDSLKLLLENSSETKTETKTVVFEALLEIFRAFGYSKTEPSLWFHNVESINYDELIHLCCLAAQAISLGLVSYSCAHTAPLDMFFLRRSLHLINLQGTHDVLSSPLIFAREIHLTCMHEMLEREVLTFFIDEGLKSEGHAYEWRLAMNRLGSSKFFQVGRKFYAKYDVSSTVEDLVDTWGPAKFILNPSSVDDEELNIRALEIGGGYLTRSANREREFHWQKNIFNPNRFSYCFGPKTQMMIGSVTPNLDCPLKETESLRESEPCLRSLGTSDDHCKVVEQAFQVNVGYYFTIQLAQTWAKVEGITLKDCALNSTCITTSFLECSWGLSFSLCTGVACRVPLIDLLGMVAEPYIEECPSVYDLWSRLKKTWPNLKEKFQKASWRDWYDIVANEDKANVSKIIRYLLEVLRPTGIDREANCLVVAWPLRQHPYQCFHIPCEGVNSWTRLLADSMDCATFACITLDCLETTSHKCRNEEALLWHNKTSSLKTEVAQYLHNEKARLMASMLDWDLKENMKYWIGRPHYNLIARVEKSLHAGETWLFVKHSRIPENIAKIIRPVQRIRERKNIDARSYPILFAGEPQRRLLVHES